MAGSVPLREVDRVEILTLADNYIDLTAMDSNQVITRALPIRDMEVKTSILAEHGFSALVRTVIGEESRAVIFDFGFSETVVPYNIAKLQPDLSEVEAAVLSHGHSDHFGSLEEVISSLPRKPVPLYLHPGAFLPHRYLKVGEIRIAFPRPDRSAWEKAGARITENTRPCTLAGDTILFLGEIERTTDFEKGMPNTYYLEEGEERRDPIIEDTGIAVHLRGKGLVILSGCAHAGIVNTVRHAVKTSGVDKVHVVMGGFHLTGPAFEPIIGKTIEELERMEPDYVVPTHCTGRKAVAEMENAFGPRFILNMPGTRLAFQA